MTASENGQKQPFLRQLDSGNAGQLHVEVIIVSLTDAAIGVVGPLGAEEEGHVGDLGRLARPPLRHTCKVLVYLGGDAGNERCADKPGCD